jgi:tetratricopeptide (TPR) repeat protein
MRFTTALRRRLRVPCQVSALAGIVWLTFFVSTLSAQQPPQAGAPASDISNIPKNVSDTVDRINVRNGPNDAEVGKKPAETDESCLLPPLSLITRPAIAEGQLRIKPKARRDYHQACVALKNKNVADAEQHLRKAIQHDPKYAAAWVTLGQVLVARQRNEEARRACQQGSTADTTYAPAYLCLADIAARAHAWAEVLKLSARVLELDPVHNAVAYEYHAAASLDLHDLTTAEKSALRAVEIDKDHREPRVHFVLAQIYEAKGDPANEALQLREYLKYAGNPDDVAAIQQFLSRLEEQLGQPKTVAAAPASSPRKIAESSQRSWAPADIDEAVPPVRTDTACPLPQVLKETSKHTQDLIENLQRISASERIDQIDIGKNGKSRNAGTQVVNYVAQIEENSLGYPTMTEYRYASSGMRQPSLVDTGTVAFALIFHPSHLENFDFRCEGLTDLQASPVWQVHFQERPDESKSFHAMRVGGSVYLPRLKGRAWIATDTFQVLRIETDLVSPIPQIDLQVEHLVIAYAPVDFQKRHVRLWLPESASLYIGYRGHRYERKHNFSDFQLFWVDAGQTIKDSNPNKDAQLQFLKIG